MQFIPGGPEIVGALVSAQEQGTTMFVCGAGISMTVGLPSFQRLTSRVYERLGQDWARHPAENEVMRKDGQLAGQYDRMLRSLERRLAASDIRGAQGMRRRIRDAIDAELALPGSIDLPDHRAVLELSRDDEGRPRLLTTNFDLLFERSWSQAGWPGIPTHAGPAMPRPGTGSFEGVLHLHGRIADTDLGLPGTDLVLNSAEFGEAYLRSGWAARYVYDLARAYTLVLVGYQADDPPMRYLLEVLEADRARYPDLKTVYAFAPAKPGDEDLQRELWRAKGIEPILYRNPEPSDHAALYDTLRAWRDYAAGPSRWREQRLKAIMAADPQAEDKAGIEEAAALLAHGDAAGLLMRVMPNADWWAPLAGHATLKERGDVLGLWIATRLDDPAMLRACATSQPHGFQVYEHLQSVLDLDRVDLPPNLAKGWRLLVQAGLSTRRGDRSLRWYMLQAKVQRGDIDHNARVAIVECVRPRLQVGCPQTWSGRSEGSDPDALTRLLHVEFNAEGHPTVQELLQALPNDLEQEVPLFRVAQRALAAALDEAHDAGHLDGLDRASYDVKALSGDGMQLETGFLPIARFVVALWDRIAAKDVLRARSLAAAWNGGPYLLQTRLHLHALTAPVVFGGEEVGAALAALDDETFWISDARREVGTLIAARWPNLPDAARTSLEVRFCSGLPRRFLWAGEEMPEPEWQGISDHMTYQQLEPVCRAGGLLTPALQALLDGIVARQPAGSLILREGDEPRLAVFSGSRGHPERLAAVPDELLVQEALRVREANEWSESEIWSLLCENDPHRALRGIRAAASDADRWRSGVIGPLLSNASRFEDAGFQQALADHLLAMPRGTPPSTIAGAAYWLSELAGKSLSDQHLLASLLQVWDNLACMVCDPDDNTAISNGSSIGDAPNSSIGRVTFALLALLGAHPWTAGQTFGPDMRRRLDFLVEAPGIAGKHARLLLMRRITYFDQIDPEWVAEKLVPRLSWSDPEASVLWPARAGSGIGSASLFNRLKASFLEAFVRLKSNKEGNEGLAFTLIQVAIWKQAGDADAYDLTFQEVRAALTAASPAVRGHVAWHLWRWMAGEKDEVFDRADRWRSHVGPLFESTWPLDASTRDGRTSHTLVLMALECGDAFPDAVAAIEDLVVPHDVATVETSLRLEAPHQDVTSQHPSAFLRLLNAITDPRIARVPFDLGKVLDQCRASSPGVERERAFIRLDGLRRQSEA